MSPEEEAAWVKFKGWLDDCRASVDGMVPVAVIFLPATVAAEGGALDVQINRGGAVLWPKDVPIAERGPLLEKLAEPYRRGTVRRR